MGPKKLLQLHFYFVALSLCSFVCAKPAPALFRDEKIEKQQELVGKIVDLIKREQIRMNLIEDDNKAEILNEKSVREEIENMIDENSIEEVSEAVELVDDALKHEPIFNDSLSKTELGDFNSKQDLQALEEEEEEETSMEDIAIGIYQALPSDMQEGIRDTYEWGNEYYANITKDLKLEWYYFQLNANEVVDTYLGPYLDPEEEEEDEYSGYKPTIEKNDDYNDGILRPGESTVTMFDVVQEFFTDLWDNWFGERSSSNWNYLRILKKRSLQQKQE